MQLDEARGQLAGSGAAAEEARREVRCRAEGGMDVATKDLLSLGSGSYPSPPCRELRWDSLLGYRHRAIQSLIPAPSSPSPCIQAAVHRSRLEEILSEMARTKVRKRIGRCMCGYMCEWMSG